ncbi:O-acetyltransferase OatA [Aphelenchoides besseyi]|nr:O-acetyltransferase OatA [Aphelenchoides besseyi]KAI6199492.1 O-acetyltransferase OatA [Aphelenchoides besseyi]
MQPMTSIYAVALESEMKHFDTHDDQLHSTDFASFKSSTEQFRPEIQSLRAVAVIGVVFFHCWASFPVGFLGLDIFFVISGYLIFSILSKEKPVNLTNLLTFYFNRISRILPSYYFTIAIVLLAVILLISPFDFDEVLKDAVPALYLYSDQIADRRRQYFDLSSNFQLMLHTWSVCLELKFYLMALPLVLFVNFLSRRRFVFALMFVLSISFWSFFFQLTSSGNISHMSIRSRLWQFLVGFLVYLLKNNNHKLHIPKRFCHRNFGIVIKRMPWIIELVPTVNLIVLLIWDIFASVQIQRLVVTFLCALIIWSSCNQNLVLNNRFLIQIGDISYSVYLVHWPILVLHRTRFSDTFDDETTIPILGMQSKPEQHKVNYESAVADIEMLWRMRNEKQPIQRDDALHLYAEITLIARPGCNPLPACNQEEMLGEEGGQTCAQFISDVVEALNEWDYAIDVLIPLFGMNGVQDPRLNGRIESDLIFQHLQSFYANLSSIAREVVFVPMMNLRFQQNQLKIIQTLLFSNQSFEKVGEPLRNQLQYMSKMRVRLEFVKCSRCIKSTWTDLWCSANDRFCRTADPRGIAFFVDEHHVSVYGSLFIGEYLRKLYDQTTEIVEVF